MFPILLVISFILVLYICWKGAEEEMRKGNSDWWNEMFGKK